MAIVVTLLFMCPQIAFFEWFSAINVASYSNVLNAGLFNMHRTLQICIAIPNSVVQLSHQIMVMINMLAGVLANSAFLSWNCLTWLQFSHEV